MNDMALNMTINFIHDLDGEFEIEASSAKEASHFIDDEEYQIIGVSDQEKFNKICNFIIMQTTSSFRQTSNKMMHTTIRAKVDWLIDSKSDSVLSASCVFRHSDSYSRSSFISYMISYLEKKLENAAHKAVSENSLKCRFFVEECIDRLKKSELASTSY